MFALSFFFFSTVGGWRWGLRCYGRFSVYCPYIPGCLSFVFEYVTTVVGSCWLDHVPHCFRCVPSDFAPTHLGMVELNWVISTWSSQDINEVSGTSSNCPPPGFFEID